MASNGPEKFNEHRTDEVAREAFCRAAQYGTKLITEAADSAEGRVIVNFDDRLASLGAFMASCTGAMLFPDKDDAGTEGDEF
jgi:hypothetical protein